MRSSFLPVVCAGAVVAGCAAPAFRATPLTSRQQLPEGVAVTSSAAAYADGQSCVLSDDEAERFRILARDAIPSLVLIRALPVSERAVGIEARGTHKTSTRSRGAGVVLTSEGVILTAEHVVHDAGEVVVTTADGSQHTAVGVATSENLDLAVLRIAEVDLRPLSLAFTPVSTGTPVAAVAACCPQVGECIRTGVVTNPAASLQNELDPTGTRQYDELIESTTELEPGFSGSPLVDLQGRFVGLNVAVVGSLERGESRGYAIPFNDRVRDAVVGLVAKVTRESVESSERRR